MQDERVGMLAQAFSTDRRSEIDAAWTIAQSIGDDLLPLLSEAFPRVLKSKGRATILRYAGGFSRESEIAFKMESMLYMTVPIQSAILRAQFLLIP